MSYTQQEEMAQVEKELAEIQAQSNILTQANTIVVKRDMSFKELIDQTKNMLRN